MPTRSPSIDLRSATHSPATTLEVDTREHGWRVSGWEAELYKETVTASSDPEPVAFTAAEREGHKMTPGQIVAYALADR